MTSYAGCGRWRGGQAVGGAGEGGGEGCGSHSSRNQMTVQDTALRPDGARGPPHQLAHYHSACESSESTEAGTPKYIQKKTKTNGRGGGGGGAGR